MADLSVNVGGIKAPNPFWLSSGPPTNTAHQVRNAFLAGWGGVVWKTVTTEQVVNVASRYGGISLGNQRLMGLNNIELISDRPLEDNLREIAEVKREFPDRAVIASVMVASTREAWHEAIKRIGDSGVDGFELNFGCPHGMNERGQGSAVGQVPEYCERIVGWAKEASRLPVLVKLTPNVTDIVAVGRAAKRGGADGISLINTINSIMGVDIDSFAPRPWGGGWGPHGGYSGPAVKPVALHMVASLAGDAELAGMPLSGIGGIKSWNDAVEFMLLGATSVQVCTAVMHKGFGIVKAMIRGLEGYMAEKGFGTIGDLRGKAVGRIRKWGDLDLNYKVIAHIHEEKCIHCGICYAACEDGCYQAIAWDKVPRGEYVEKFGEPKKTRADQAAPALALEGIAGGVVGKTATPVDVFTVKTDVCVGCNMCALACPVEGCITMDEVPTVKGKMSWNEYQKMLSEGKVERIEPTRTGAALT
ncbi:MAG TPA: NAD-dependent dihydropyrimidine dehydrogenase subunit PreA [Phycisphaerae bacterium]|nr:NAD-dependent dihydropyrimidine dehydrogenase subunit PreA [Phycisphaerae bacterium]